MNDAPERIWTWGVEYVRADIYRALTAERDRLAGINVKLCDNFNTPLIDGAWLQARADAAEAEWRKYEGAWMTAEGKLADVEAERDRLRVALTDAGAYLDRGLDKMAFNIIRAALKGESHE